MFKHLPNLKIVRTFECAARKQSYSLAAEELYISQAAVSQQMRLLESQLRCKLFTRQDKKMMLTQQGEAFYQATFSALSTLSDCVHAFSKGGVSPQITITSTQAFINLWLMPKLSLFSDQHPDIQINVLASSGFDDLNAEHIDLAIRFGQNVTKNTPNHYRCEFFGEDKVLPVCSQALANKYNFQTPNDFLKTWLVSLDEPGPFNWPDWFKACHSSKYKTHTQWTYVPSTDMALNAVLNQHGVTLAAEYLFHDLITQGNLCVPVNIPHPNKVKRYFVYPQQSQKNQRLKRFMDWLKSEMNHN